MPEVWPYPAAGAYTLLGLRALVDGLLEPGDVTARYWWPYAVLWVVFVVWGWSYMLESLYDLGWEFILGGTGLLAWDRVLATITLNGGRLIMLTAMLWGA